MPRRFGEDRIRELLHRFGPRKKRGWRMSCPLLNGAKRVKQGAQKEKETRKVRIGSTASEAHAITTAKKEEQQERAFP